MPPEEGNDKPLLNTHYLENPEKGHHMITDLMAHDDDDDDTCLLRSKGTTSTGLTPSKNVWCCSPHSSLSCGKCIDI